MTEYYVPSRAEGGSTKYKHLEGCRVLKTCKGVRGPLPEDHPRLEPLDPCSVCHDGDESARHGDYSRSGALQALKAKAESGDTEIVP